MKLLVTGLSGLVGSRFQQLFGDKHECVNLDLSNGIDITNSNQVQEIFLSHADAVAVIHLAAYTNVSAAFEQNGDKNGPCYRVNVTGTENIAAATKETGKYLIHISTDYVFDGHKTEAYTETDTPCPIEWYGQTKLWAEEAVVSRGGKSLILRLAFPYQAKPSRPDFLAKIMAHLQAGTLPPAFTDHVITPTFVDDVAHVFDYCATNQPEGIYHMVGSSSHTDFDIAQMVNDRFNLKGQVKAGSLSEYVKQINRPYQQTMRVSNAKLERDFNLKMRSLEAGLAEIAKQIG